MDEKTFTERLYDRITLECKIRNITLGELSRAIGKGESYLRVCKSKQVCPSAYTFTNICHVLSISAEDMTGNKVESSVVEKLVELYSSNISFRKMADSLM